MLGNNRRRKGAVASLWLVVPPCRATGVAGRFHGARRAHRPERVGEPCGDILWSPGRAHLSLRRPLHRVEAQADCNQAAYCWCRMPPWQAGSPPPPESDQVQDARCSALENPVGTAMRLTLMAAVPCKRFDFQPRCTDGRGGWVFSQFGADRYVAEPSKHGIKLGLAFFAQPVVTGDYVEYTELTASMSDEVLGTDTTEWRIPNTGGRHHEQVSVYEWIQAVDAPVTQSGLIRIQITAKLNSQDAPLVVDGCAYVHTTVEDTNHELVTPKAYQRAVKSGKETRSW